MDGALWPGLALLLALWKAAPLVLEGPQPVQAPSPVPVPSTECKCVFEGRIYTLVRKCATVALIPSRLPAWTNKVGMHD